MMISRPRSSSPLVLSPLSSACCLRQRTVSEKKLVGPSRTSLPVPHYRSNPSLTRKHSPLDSRDRANQKATSFHPSSTFSRMPTSRPRRKHAGPYPTLHPVVYKNPTRSDTWFLKDVSSQCVISFNQWTTRLSKSPWTVWRTS